MFIKDIIPKLDQEKLKTLDVISNFNFKDIQSQQKLDFGISLDKKVLDTFTTIPGGAGLNVKIIFRYGSV